MAPHERGLLAVRGQVELVEELHDALRGVDVIRDLGERLGVARLIKIVWGGSAGVNPSATQHTSARWEGDVPRLAPSPILVF